MLKYHRRDVDARTGRPAQAGPIAAHTYRGEPIGYIWGCNPACRGSPADSRRPIMTALMEPVDFMRIEARKSTFTGDSSGVAPARKEACLRMIRTGSYHPKNKSNTGIKRGRDSLKI
jgi:hypothetical protein